ncbi:Uncharacterised protein [Vibrio cholerae]|nr:Uncharacterised protein [Vibrio cholerae]CSI57329.1 Uncharacterised protein [Vibrio cholerae]
MSHRTNHNIRRKVAQIWYQIHFESIQSTLLSEDVHRQ